MFFCRKIAKFFLLNMRKIAKCFLLFLSEIAKSFLPFLSEIAKCCPKTKTSEPKIPFQFGGLIMHYALCIERTILPRFPSRYG